MIQQDALAGRDSAAVVIVDVQERLAAVMTHRDPVIDRTRLLIESARIVGVPVVVTRQYPKGLGDLCSGIAEKLDDAAARGCVIERVDKVTFDCFAEADFARVIDGLGRRQLIVAGMETHICVCQTVLAALRRDYDVQVVDDACCSRDDSAHYVTTRRLARAGATITTAESVAYEFVGRADTADFKELLAAVKG